MAAMQNFGRNRKQGGHSAVDAETQKVVDLPRSYQGLR
jgi:hypothetical protein